MVWLSLAIAWILLAAPGMAADRQKGEGDGKDHSHGKYIAIISGCNDCHTPGYSESGGTTPSEDWLTGDRVGWKGPWGTTYPTNLRIYMSDITEENWLKKSRQLRTRPPMPWWALRTLKDGDAVALYWFIRSLGRKGQIAPTHLPPDQEPRTPFILFVPQPPRK